MNCKPGDLAVVVRSPFATQLIGRIVEVLHAAPSGDFRLPNGQKHIACHGNYLQWWVCKFQNSIDAPHETKGFIKTVYAPVPDECLRPIRDNDDEDEMIRIAGVPHGEFA